MSPKVSILIHNINRVTLTGRCLASVARLSYRPLEVIVLDAGSVDGSQEVIETTLAGMRVCGIEARMVPVPMAGVARSRNIAASEARGELLVFLDNDAALAGDSDLGAVVERFRRDPALGAVSFRILDHDTVNVDRSCWIFHRPAARWSTRAFETFTFAGGACCLRASTFRQIGGYWEYIAYGREEEEMSLALFGLGMKLSYDPAVTVRHYPGERPKSALAKRRVNELRNGVLVFWRRLPIPIACLLIAFRVGTMSLRSLMWEGTGLLPLWRGLASAPRDWRAGAGQRVPIGYAAAARYVRRLLPVSGVGALNICASIPTPPIRRGRQVGPVD